MDSANPPSGPPVPGFAQDLPFLTLQQACRVHARHVPPPSPTVELGQRAGLGNPAFLLGVATGALMEEEALTAEHAWQRIARAGYHGGLGVILVADQFLRTGRLDNPWCN
ncbi:MAG TPA: hypothetical protein VFM86_11250 [Pedococcus sp.]|nr:hypothetical protein [Pedococcus sp.]